MGRRARRQLLYKGCYAHVFSRSIEKKYIIEDAEGFEHFEMLLKKTKRIFRFKLFHYCLLHTHYHLVVGLDEVESFSAGMKWLKWQYTNAYNRRRIRRGTVWQGRYKSLVIENEMYLRACGEYVEANSVDAGCVKRATDWRYSSARHNSRLEKNELVDPYECDGSIPNSLREAGKRIYEHGDGIGSALFRFSLKEQLQNMSVP